MSDELRKAAQQILCGEVVQMHGDFVVMRMYPEPWQKLAQLYLDEHPEEIEADTPVILKSEG